jgi:hypothetical protein
MNTFVLIFLLELPICKHSQQLIRNELIRSLYVCISKLSDDSVAFFSQYEMKLVKTVLFSVMCAAAYAITVEEAWENYKVNPKKPDNPDWVKPIPDFETFKKRWDEAKAYNAKYATTQDAWEEYKVSI